MRGKYAQIIVVVLALVVVAGVGYVWASRLADRREVREVISEPAEEKSGGDEAIDTWDWKTYRDEEYGFNLKYPKGWKIIDSRDPNAVFYAISPEEFFRVMSVSIYENSNLPDILKRKSPPDQGMISSEKYVIVNNIKGVEQVINGFGCFVNVFLPVKSDIFLVHYQADPTTCDNPNAPEFMTFLNNLLIRP